MVNVWGEVNIVGFLVRLAADTIQKQPLSLNSMVAEW